MYYPQVGSDYVTINGVVFLIKPHKAMEDGMMSLLTLCCVALVKGYVILWSTVENTRAHSVIIQQLSLSSNVVIPCHSLRRVII